MSINANSSPLYIQNWAPTPGAVNTGRNGQHYLPGEWPRRGPNPIQQPDLGKLVALLIELIKQLLSKNPPNNEGVSSRAMGEEGGISTQHIGEEGGRDDNYDDRSKMPTISGTYQETGISLMGPHQESGGSIPTTRALSETGERDGRITTMAMGEEGGSLPPKWEKQDDRSKMPTISGTYQETGVSYLGPHQESGGSIPTTMALNETGGNVTSLAMGEEGGSLPPR